MFPPPATLPITGGAPDLELNKGSWCSTTKKNLGVPGSPTGEIWGVKFQLPPSPLEIGETFIHFLYGKLWGPMPPTSVQNLKKFYFGERVIFSRFICWRIAGIRHCEKRLIRSHVICWILLHTRRGRSRGGYCPEAPSRGGEGRGHIVAAAGLQLIYLGASAHR